MKSFAKIKFISGLALILLALVSGGCAEYNITGQKKKKAKAEPPTEVDPGKKFQDDPGFDVAGTPLETFVNENIHFTVVGQCTGAVVWDLGNGQVFTTSNGNPLDFQYAYPEKGTYNVSATCTVGTQVVTRTLVATIAIANNPTNPGNCGGTVNPCGQCQCQCQCQCNCCNGCNNRGWF